MQFEAGDEVEVRVRLKVPNNATAEDVKEYVTEALGDFHDRFPPHFAFYGFDDSTIKVMEVTK
jgi:hypothetical protein